jgi:DNA-binding MarR family transcriptional regulator/N-acetylglutamate synthase-like GNAT family acetyltransferase
MELPVRRDVVSDLGYIFLGSRLKRLGERMQVGAARVIADAGLPVQPAHMPLLAALDQGDLTVGQLAEAVGSSQPGVTRGVGQLVALGLVDSASGADQRRRTLSLTPAGRAAMARVRMRIWPRVGRAAADLCDGLSGGLLDQLSGLEQRLAEQPLDVRVARVPDHGLSVRDYEDALAPLFHDINAEWIEAMFEMEQADREVLENPRRHILDGGGTILFVEAPGLGVIGTCALRNAGNGWFELTKMGVREAARGLKAGEFLLAAMLSRAQELGAENLYLLTNARCAPAIHLYEKLGFVHDREIMARFGARYCRCDVAMRYLGPATAAAAA